MHVCTHIRKSDEENYYNVTDIRRIYAKCLFLYITQTYSECIHI